MSGIDRFLHNEDHYANRGIPYKFCVMLTGKPGTGKTSLIHAIASHYRRDINYVTRLGSMNSLLSDRSLRPAITVIEDIDTLADSLNRNEPSEPGDPTPAVLHHGKSGESKDPMGTLHDLLNSMDGFTSQHGMFVIITSNHPERLDNALVRPGRIDLVLEMGVLDFNIAGRMFASFYPESEHMWSRLKNSYVPVVGARLQQLFLENSAERVVEILGENHEHVTENA